MSLTFKTIDEIAAQTGVSVTTVRLVLNGQAERYRISAATRKRIEDYVANHEVIINHAARSLKLQRSETIGLVVPNLGNAFFARLMAQLESCCQANNLMLLTASSHEDPKLEALAIKKLLERGVDGMVIAPCQSLPVALFAHYLKRVGVIVVDRAYPSSPFPTVVSNNRESARQLTTRLLEESGGDVIFLCAQTGLPSIRDRIDGFAEAVAAAGRDDWKALVRYGDDSDMPTPGAQLIRELVATGRVLPRALMCSSLVVLEGALQEIKAQFGQLPADILLGTFDTEAMLEFIPNRVISVIQDEAAIAKKAFAQLLAQDGGEPTRISHDIIPCRFTSWGALPGGTRGPDPGR
jgi:LacI family fructose operon transcriptional repressor